MISTKPSGLFLHVKSKHDKEVATPEKCFPALKGFDPANPDVARRRPALGPRAARARVRPAAAGLGAPRARETSAPELASTVPPRNRSTFSFVGQSRRRGRRRAREEEEGREEGGKPRGPPLRGPQRRRQEEEVGSPVIRSRVDVWDALERSSPGEVVAPLADEELRSLKKGQHDGTMPL